MPTWLMLAAAIVSEVIGTSALRQSDGFTRPLPVALMLTTYAISFYLLSLVVRDFPLGLTYAIWAGAGTALIACIGVFAFEESIGFLGAIGIVLVIVGIVVINFSSAV